MEHQRSEREMKREWGPHQKKWRRAGKNRRWLGAERSSTETQLWVDGEPQLGRPTRFAGDARPSRFAALWHRRPECLKGARQWRRWEALREGAARDGVRRLAAGGRIARRLAWLTEAAQFWPGTHQRGAALGPATPRGEGDELDSARSRDWPVAAARGKLRRDGQDGRASEREGEAVRGPICCGNGRRGEGPGQRGDRGEAWAGCSMRRCRGAWADAARSRAGGQRRDMTWTTRVLSERCWLMGPAQGERKYGSAHEEQYHFPFIQKKI
jgi:hypothetical protein